ncbi:MAG: hypothetical protein U1F50_10750 [Rubrivivax sp.]
MVVVENLLLALASLAECRVDDVLDALPAVRRVVESRRLTGLRVPESYSRPEGALRLAMRRGDAGSPSSARSGASRWCCCRIAARTWIRS